MVTHTIYDLALFPFLVIVQMDYFNRLLALTAFTSSAFFNTNSSHYLPYMEEYDPFWLSALSVLVMGLTNIYVLFLGTTFFECMEMFVRAERSVSIRHKIEGLILWKAFSFFSSTLWSICKESIKNLIKVFIIQQAIMRGVAFTESVFEDWTFASIFGESRIMLMLVETTLAYGTLSMLYNFRLVDSDALQEAFERRHSNFIKREILRLVPDKDQRKVDYNYQIAIRRKPKDMSKAPADILSVGIAMLSPMVFSLFYEKRMQALSFSESELRQMVVREKRRRNIDISEREIQEGVELLRRHDRLCT